MAGGDWNNEDEDAVAVADSSEAPGRTTAELRMYLERSSFRGPLPPPELLARYEAIQSGLAERIVALTERQQLHRQDVERQIVHGEIASLRRGQWLGWSMGVFAIAAAILLVVLGQPVAGIALVFTSISAIVGNMVWNNYKESRQPPAEEQPKQLPDDRDPA